MFKNSLLFYIAKPLRAKSNDRVGHIIEPSQLLLRGSKHYLSHCIKIHLLKWYSSFAISSLVLLWVVVVILLAFIVTLSVTNTTKNPMETKEDYERIIGTLEDREWKVSESTLKNLQTLIPQTKGEASTALEGDRITLTILISNGDSYTLTFTYRNGRIISLFKGEIIYLEYTETVYGGGKTLTLYYRNEKIVFKEKR